MKKIFLSLALFGLVSCCPQTTYLATAKANWDLIGPEYTAYVSADAALDEGSKATRLRTAELFSKMLEEANK